MFSTQAAPGAPYADVLPPHVLQPQVLMGALGGIGVETYPATRQPPPPAIVSLLTMVPNAMVAEVLADHYLRLGEEGLRMRFGATLKRSSVASRSASIRREHVGAILAMGACGPRLPKLLAIDAEAPHAEACGRPPLPAVRAAFELSHTAGADFELGLSVEPAHQGAGLGTLLFDAACATSRILGARRLHVVCLDDNRPMKRLIRRSDCQVQRSHGEVYAEVIL